MSDLTGPISNKDNSGFKGGTDTTEVIISGMGFSPATITIAAGTTITWTNKDEVVNIVTSETGLFNGVISSNETYSYMFSTAGNYQYFNRVHPSITGNIIVN
jgi:Plastocyanin